MEMIKPTTARVRYFLVYKEEGVEEEHPVFFCGSLGNMERVFGFNAGHLIACDLVGGEVEKMLKRAVKDDKINIGVKGDGGTKIFSGREEKERMAECCVEVMKDSTRK